MIFHSSNAPILALPENMPLEELQTANETPYTAYTAYTLTDQTIF